MSKRSLTGDSIWSLANAIISVLAAFTAFKIVTHYLGVESLGLWALAAAAMFPLRFADLSVNSAVLRYLGAMSSDRGDGPIFRVIGTATLINCAAFAIFVAASFAMAPTVIRETVPRPAWTEAFDLLPFLAVTAFCQLLAGAFNCAMLGLHRFRFAYVLGIAASVTQVAVMFPAISRLGIAGFAVAQATSYLLQVLACLGALTWFKMRHPAADSGEAFDFRAFFGFAMKLNLNTILATLIDPLAKIVLGRFTTLSTVGGYEVVSRIFNQMRAVLVAPLQPWAVAMVRSFAQDRNAFNRVYEISLLYSICAAVAVALAALPAFLVFRYWLHIDTPALPMLVLVSTIIVTSNLLAVPAYNACVAIGRIGPILAATVSSIFIIGTCGPALGWMVGEPAVLMVIAGGYAAAAAILMAIPARQGLFRVVPPLTTLRDHFRTSVAAIHHRLGRLGTRGF